ncbi:periplasmic ligand-binding sensor domain protein [Legionella wadsworthii]|uniref:Periplasmic ligand-binding sensor domain protein n=1 Tax=Legionella wadsworthii TaxID=28088 RepID=A0A378LSD9_9GAMM|nr:hypothetical protein [Legionella wadsworthii]STY28768.1 periplasmic ligand-binding sensor domain protein [Legionella wadsworthii]
MQTKKETQTPKSGTSSTSSFWNMPDVSNASWLVAPMDLMKHRMQMQQSGKSTPTPIWNLQSLTNLSALMFPIDVMKQRLQTQQTRKAPTTPIWNIQTFYNAAWSPFEVVKQSLSMQPKPGHKPPAPVWAYPSIYSATWEVVKQQMTYAIPGLVMPFEVAKHHMKYGVQPPTSPTVQAVRRIYSNVSAYMPSMDAITQQIWNGANFLTVAATTSTCIVAVQSPVKTMSLSLVKNGTFLPPNSAGLSNIMGILYSGGKAGAATSLGRSIYVSGAKGGSKSTEEGIHEASREDGRKYAAVSYPYVLTMALGEVVVTNGPDTLGSLQKVPGLLPKDFVWKTPYNITKLMTGGAELKYASAIFNFGALCILEERIASGLPIQDKRAAHFASGMLSGMAAAMVTHPINSLREYGLVQFRVDNGRLHNVSTVKLCQELFYCFTSDPKAALKSFGNMSLKRVPINATLTGLIFAFVAGINETMGPEPLNVFARKPQTSSPGRTRQSMFGGSEATTPRIEEVVEEQTSEKDNSASPK